MQRRKELEVTPIYKTTYLMPLHLCIFAIFLCVTQQY
jgi:hypothetical protein